MTIMARLREADLVKEMTMPLFLCAFLSALGGISFGIDYGYWSGMLGMTQFKKDFGVFDEETEEWILPASYLSGGSGPPMAGLALGSLASGWIGSRFGRLRTFRLSIVVGLVGVTIQGAALGKFWQLIIGRAITAFSLGIIANAIPAYLAEISPLKIRGTLINCYQFSIGIGGLVIMTANWGMHERTDQWAYRTSILLQIPVPIAFLAGNFWVPESPRWLVGRQRQEEALKVLVRLRTNVPEAVVAEEVSLIVAQEAENREHFSRSWIECFKGTNLRRTMIAAGVQCLQQAQGNSFMSSYRVIFFQQLGLSDVYKLSIYFMLTMLLSSALAFYFADQMGRRPILMVCAGLMVVTMAVVTGLATEDGLNPNAMKGALTALFIWEICLSFGWSSCVWIVTAETPSLQLREKTIMVATVAGFCASILITFVVPFIQAPEAGGLGSRIGYMFAGISLLSTLWVIFFVPETGYRSLEELDELFANRVSVWKFKSYQTSGYGAQIAAIDQAEPNIENLKSRTSVKVESA